MYHASTTYVSIATQNSVSISAGGGVDYSTPNPTSFIFTAGQSLQCINISINDDSLCEGDVDENFIIMLTQSSPVDSGVSVSPAFATVSIDDNDGNSLFITTLCMAHSKRFCF